MLTVVLWVLAKLRKATISFVMSVHPSVWNNWAPPRRNFIKFDIWEFSENLSKVSLKSDICERYFISIPIYCTLMIISRSVPLRMRNVSNKNCRGNKKLCSVFFSPENRTIYEIMWKKIAQPERLQMKMAHALFALST